MLFNALEGRKGVAGLKRKSLRQQRPQMSQTESGFIENNVTIIQRLKKGVGSFIVGTTAAIVVEHSMKIKK